jgi:hypothetical protein
MSRYVVEKVIAPYGFSVVDTETGAVVETFKRKYMANAEAFLHNMTTMKTVTSLMSGAEIAIPVGTPLACDPSSETYWSM